MKKDNIRDYATEAFRFYAACGKLTSAELEQMVRDRIYQQSKREFLRSGSGVPFSPTEYAAMKAEDAVRDLQAEMMDIIAVEKTLKRLNSQQRKAVEIVYFTDAEKDLERNDISDRVHRAELEIPASTDTIFRWLRLARRTFAEERGLRISGNKKILLQVNSSST